MNLDDPISRGQIQEFEEQRAIFGTRAVQLAGQLSQAQAMIQAQNAAIEQLQRSLAEAEAVNVDLRNQLKKRRTKKPVDGQH